MEFRCKSFALTALILILPLGARAERLLNHILVIYGENEARIPARAEPYLGTLADTYVEYTDYHGVAHPSMPNYLALTSGAPQVTTNVGCTSLAVTNLADRFEAAGIDWRGYNQDMLTPCSDTVNYVSKHDFFVNYTSVRNNPARLAKIRGFNSKNRATYAELLGPNAPPFVAVAPNLCDDGHNCGVARFDEWLAGTTNDTFFQDLLASPYYTDGAIFLTFDEDDYVSDNRVYCVAISAQGVPGLTDNRALTHYSLLRAIEDNFGLATMTANDAAATQSMLTAFHGRTATSRDCWQVR